MRSDVAFRDALQKALRIKPGSPLEEPSKYKFSMPRFLAEFYRSKGKGYHFLFKKNLDVTNIQFAELATLISAHSTIETPLGFENSVPIRFTTINAFKELITQVTLSAAHLYNDIEAFLDHIVDQCSSLIDTLIVLDPFYNSCSAYLPPKLSIDLASICAYSGYIHSCGRHIYTRPINGAAYASLKEAMDCFISLGQPDGSEIKRKFFAVYSHEDFTAYDRDLEDELSHGLDECKIYVEKYYMGNDSLLEIIEYIKEDFKDSMVVPRAGDYREVHVRYRAGELGAFDRSSTLWLVQDKDCEFRGPHSRRYYICYEQQYRNENPIHIFDENKPAWYDHTTLPHTLASAMLNLANGTPGRKEGPKLEVYDPFLGSGTTLIESLKLPHYHLTGADYLPFAKTVTQDNLEFFAFNNEDLQQIQTMLSPWLTEKCRETESKSLAGKRRVLNEWKNLAERSDHKNTLVPAAFQGVANNSQLDKEERTVVDAYRDMMNVINAILMQPGEKPRETFKVSNYESAIKRLSSDHRPNSAFAQILLYVALRTIRRSIGSMVRETFVWEKTFCSEATRLYKQIKRLIKVRSFRNVQSSQSGTYAVVQGDYSFSTTIPAESYKETNRFLAGVETVSVMDRKQWEIIKSRGVDLVVTDPPYGFNTEESIEELGKLYRVFLDGAVSSMKDGGQLILCLPEISYTGRRPYYFTNVKLVSHLVVECANRYQLELVNPYKFFTTSNEPGLSQPFYWESEKAMRRCILHFRFRCPSSQSRVVPQARTHTSESAVECEAGSQSL